MQTGMATHAEASGSGAAGVASAMGITFVVLVGLSRAVAGRVTG